MFSRMEAGVANSSFSHLHGHAQPGGEGGEARPLDVGTELLGGGEGDLVAGGARARARGTIG